jgi:hypothetical protein
MQQWIDRGVMLTYSKHVGLPVITKALKNAIDEECIRYCSIALKQGWQGTVSSMLN